MQLRLLLGVHCAAHGQALGQFGVDRQRLGQLRHQRADGLGCHGVQQATLQRDHEGDLRGRRLRRQAGLRQRGPDAAPARHLGVHFGVELGAETGEQFQLQKLGVFQAQRAHRFAHQRRLRFAAHAAHAQARVHRGQLPEVKLLGVEHDLAIGDGDQVGRDVGGQVAGFGLGNRQGGERTAAALGREHGGALQQAGMQVEHIAGVGFAAGWLLHQQRQLAVGGGVFAQIVHDHQGVLPSIAEILRHRKTGKRCQPLQAGRGGAGRDHKNATLGRAQALHGVDHRGRRLRLLPDRDVDTDQLAVALGQKRVHRHRGFAGAPVADDELALTAPEREQGIDGQRAGVHRLAHQGAVDDGGRRALGGQKALMLDGRAAVERSAQRVHHPAQQARPHRHLHHTASPGHRLPGAYPVGFIEQDAGNVVVLQAGGIAHAAFGKVQQFVEAHIGQAGDLGNAIGHAVHPADFFKTRGGRWLGGNASPGGGAPWREVGRKLGREGRCVLAHVAVACISALAAASSAAQLCESTPCSKCSSAPRSKAGWVSSVRCTLTPS